MATGDQLDFETRITAILPSSWFTGTTPVASALISGMAWGLSLIYSLFDYVKNQTRIATATDGWLDLIAADYFGSALMRKINEGNETYRKRILANLLVERGTRSGMIKVLTLLTGRAPVIFEPQRPADTGAWDAGCGFDAGGGWADNLPCQAFITAYRPLGTGIPNIAGYDVPTGAFDTASQAEWADMSMISGAITDADIYATVDATKVAGTTVWTRISS